MANTTTFLPSQPNVYYIGCPCSHGNTANSEITAQLLRLNTTLDRLEETVTRLAQKVNAFINSREDRSPRPGYRNDHLASESDRPYSPNLGDQHRSSSSRGAYSPLRAPVRHDKSDTFQTQLLKAQKENQRLSNQIRILETQALRNRDAVEELQRLRRHNTALEREMEGIRQQLEAHKTAFAGLENLGRNFAAAVSRPLDLRNAEALVDENARS